MGRYSMELSNNTALAGSSVTDSTRVALNLAKKNSFHPNNSNIGKKVHYFRRAFCEQDEFSPPGGVNRYGSS